MNTLREWLADGPLITDGAWGTELQKLGLEAGTVPDSWNLAHPERVEQVGRAYAEAGSEVILTNTFRANAIAMKGVSASDLDAINRSGVRLSRMAAGRALVFASMGPTGKMLLSGEISREEAGAAFAAQAQSLAGAGADALLVETMSDVEEARVAVDAARRTNLPVLVSFAFDSGRNKDRTMMGATPEDVAAAMQDAGASAVGANCGLGVEGAVPICRRLHEASHLPIWIKPNAGLPAMEGASVHYATSAGLFASYYKELVEAGASFVGGCCGSTPEFIRALVKAKKMQAAGSSGPGRPGMR